MLAVLSLVEVVVRRLAVASARRSCRHCATLAWIHEGRRSRFTHACVRNTRPSKLMTFAAAPIVAVVKVNVVTERW